MRKGWRRRKDGSIRLRTMNRPGLPLRISLRKWKGKLMDLPLTILNL